MSAGGERATGRWLAACIIGALVLAGCGGSDGDAAASSTTTDDAAETSTTEPPTTSTTAPTTTETTVDPDTELADRLMNTMTEFSEAYGECLADTASCEVETTIGPYLGEPFGGEVRSAMQEWAADGLQFRGFESEEYVYRRHALALEEPTTYALEVCILSGPQAIYSVSEFGEETLVEDLGDSSARILQLLLEERSSDELVINVSETSEASAEGDSCTVDDGE